MNNKAIVIGASSGIGRALARQLAVEGYALGIAARRTELLQELAAELPGETVVQTMDASRPEEAVSDLKRLIHDLGGLDLLIYCSGTGYINRELDLSREMSTIEVNVSGFVALTNVAMKHFREQGCGHLVGISSIAALRGGADAQAYGASKAFMSNYLEALRQSTCVPGNACPCPSRISGRASWIRTWPKEIGCFGWLRRKRPRGRSLMR